MIWVILTFLGVPLWLVAGGLLASGAHALWVHDVLPMFKGPVAAMAVSGACGPVALPDPGWAPLMSGDDAGEPRS